MRYRDHAAFVRRFEDRPVPLPVHGPDTLGDARRRALIELLGEAWKAGGDAGAGAVLAYEYGPDESLQTFDEWVAERLSRDWAAVESALFLARPEPAR